jgi:hypothetical protein
MKFATLTASIIISVLSSTPTESCGDFYSGLDHGVQVAEYMWSQGGSSCSNIWSFDDEVNDYLDKNYPTDTSNWRTNACNQGVEEGAQQVVEKYEYECLGESPDECYDLGLAAAQQIAYNFCPRQAIFQPYDHVPSYKAQCKDVAESVCEGAVYRYVDCDITTSELLDLQKDCEDQIESMVGVDDDAYMPPTVEYCIDALDCESCLRNSKCTWFADIGYCETGCGMAGCGAQVCAAEINTCKKCLGGPGTSASGQYSWSPYTNECVEDCIFAPADAPCYKGKSSADPSGYDPSICAKINDMHGKSVVA